MDINLLPWREEIIEVNKKMFTRLLVVSLILSGVFLMFIYYLFFEKVGYVENYTQELEKAKLSLVSSVSAYFSYQKIQKEMNERYLFLQKMQLRRFETVYLLNEVAKTTPKGVYLKTLTRDDDRVSLVAVANSNLLIAEMMKQIDASEYLKTLSLQKVEKTQGQNYSVTDFDLQLLLKTPSFLDNTSGKKTDKIELQNPIDVIQKARDEKNSQINNASKT